MTTDFLQQAHSRSSPVKAFVQAGRFLLRGNADNKNEVDGTSSDLTNGLASASTWLPVWGLLIGIAYAGAFAIAWLWLGEYQRIRLAPMAILLALDLGWFGYRPLEAAARVLLSWRTRGTAPMPMLKMSAHAISSDDHNSNNVVPNDIMTILGPLFRVVVFVVLVVLIKYALLLSLPKGETVWPADWRENLGLLYPSVIYRPLILMPIWGRWAVLLALTIGRVAPAGSQQLHVMTQGNSQRLQMMAQGSSLRAVLLAWLAITALTIIYCSPDRHHISTSLLISLASLVVAYLASFALSRRFGGQTEASVLAVGGIVELAFLLIYLPIARDIYWY